MLVNLAGSFVFHKKLTNVSPNAQMSCENYSWSARLHAPLGAFSMLYVIVTVKTYRKIHPSSCSSHYLVTPLGIFIVSTEIHLTLTLSLSLSPIKVLASCERRCMRRVTWDTYVPSLLLYSSSYPCYGNPSLYVYRVSLWNSLPHESLYCIKK